MEKVGAVNIRIPKNTLIDSCFFCLFLEGMLKQRQVANGGKRAVE